MDLTPIIKAAAGWWAVLLPLSLFIIMMCGPGFVATLRFVLEALDSIGG